MAQLRRRRKSPARNRLVEIGQPARNRILRGVMLDLPSQSIWSALRDSDQPLALHRVQRVVADLLALQPVQDARRVALFYDALVASELFESYEREGDAVYAGLLAAYIQATCSPAVDRPC